MTTKRRISSFASRRTSQSVWNGLRWLWLRERTNERERARERKERIHYMRGTHTRSSCVKLRAEQNGCAKKTLFTRNSRKKLLCFPLWHFFPILMRYFTKLKNEFIFTGTFSFLFFSSFAMMVAPAFCCHAFGTRCEKVRGTEVPKRTLVNYTCLPGHISVRAIPDWNLMPLPLDVMATPLWEEMSDEFDDRHIAFYI